MTGQEFGLVGDQLLERFAEVEREMACAVMLDLAAGRRPCIALVSSGGVTLSVSLMQNRIGNAIFFAARPGR